MTGLVSPLLAVQWTDAVGLVLAVLLVVYLVIGWVALLKIGDLTGALPTLAGILIVIGGLVYTAGAVVYGRKSPNPSSRWFGFHEVFHAATIVAAALHHVAIWLLILD